MFINCRSAFIITNAILALSSVILFLLSTPDEIDLVAGNPGQIWKHKLKKLQQLSLYHFFYKYPTPVGIWSNLFNFVSNKSSREWGNSFSLYCWGRFSVKISLIFLYFSFKFSQRIPSPAFFVLKFLKLSNNNWTSSSAQIKFILGDLFNFTFFFADFFTKYVLKMFLFVSLWNIWEELTITCQFKGRVFNFYIFVCKQLKTVKQFDLFNFIVLISEIWNLRDRKLS